MKITYRDLLVHVLVVDDDLPDLLDAGIQGGLLHHDVLRDLHLDDVLAPGLQGGDGRVEVDLGLGHLAGVGQGRAKVVED